MYRVNGSHLRRRQCSKACVCNGQVFYLVRWILRPWVDGYTFLPAQGERKTQQTNKKNKRRSHSSCHCIKFTSLVRSTMLDFVKSHSTYQHSFVRARTHTKRWGWEGGKGLPHYQSPPPEKNKTNIGYYN